LPISKAWLVFLAKKSLEKFYYLGEAILVVVLTG